MTDMVQEHIQKIVDETKISRSDLQKKIEEKMNSLGNLISEDGAVHIIANELGVSLHETPTSELAVSSLTAQLRNATILVKVVRKYDIRTFGEGGKVGNIYAGDPTGFVRITFWNDKTKYLDGIAQGDTLLIQNAYTKENNGRVEVHLGNSSHCVVNPPGRTVVLKERQDQPEAAEKKLQDITSDDAVVQITATVVQVYDPRFFESCPECNKRLQQSGDSFICVDHGSQEPQYNYVLNAFLDDGSDTVRATLWKEQAQELFSLSGEEFLGLRTNQELLDVKKNDVLGRIISARARVRINDQYNSKELVLYDINVHPNPLDATTAKEPEESPSSTTNQVKEQLQPKERSLNQEVTEELFDEDDEELLSIDDLEEDY